MSLNWAIEKKHAEQPELLDANHRKIIWFDILEFLNYIQLPWTLDPDDLKYRSVRKIDAAKEHFVNGGWMDPTDVQGNIIDLLEGALDDDDRIIVEGRHRLVAALQLGETYAPFSVPHELVKRLKSAITSVDRV